MSKKTNNLIPLGVPMDGRVIYDYQIGSLEGQLLTFIETFGFTENREKATKDVLKNILRENLYIQTTYVGGEYLNKAIVEYRSSGDGVNTR